MDEIYEIFATIPPWHRSLLFISGLVFFWIIEGLIPLSRKTYNRYNHAGLNLIFTIFFLIIGLGSAWVLLQVSNFTSEYGFGIIAVVALPAWVEFIIGLLVLDLVGAYMIHFIEHHVIWMWKFHLIHHSDTNIDVTSGLRHHPGEAIFRMVFTAVAIFLVGAPLGLILLYQTISAIFAQLTHANISLPPKLDKWLSYIIVTPNMHKVHHHYLQPLTDTNYGNIFSIWDRIFGSYAYEDPKNLRYGIDTHFEPSEHSSVKNLLSVPFQKYRPNSKSKFYGEA